MELNIFKKKKSEIIIDIIQQRNKIWYERSKLANMELSIIHSDLPIDLLELRNKIAMMRYEADKAETPYELFLHRFYNELKQINK